MHLLHDFGNTVNEIEKCGYKIDAKIENISLEDSGVDMAKSVGLVITEFSDVVMKIKPDILLALTDLGHALATAIVGVYMNIPVAHIHGGDVSGTADEPVRHAITKLSHIHFPATQKSCERIIKLGEEPWRVHVVGAPGLDSILNQDLLSRSEIYKKYGIKENEHFLLMIQHPVTTEFEEAAKQIRETLDAIAELKHQTILIYPNADAGYLRMIEVIKEYTDKFSFINAYKSIPHLEYLSLMNAADVMVGNSSSGIIEAPSFQLPVVNIGIRQQDRERADNVVDVDNNKEEIKKAIEKALYDEKFIEKVKKCKSPYGDGKAAEKIVEVLNSITIDEKMIMKRMTY
jgi:UDP-N-acetylglucosamine 2-epimerase (non-hydrolysing)/GDP/UDP-N,N'-diacetylbacillosamine 2-epimerase (hydrolysing)